MSNSPHAQLAILIPRLSRYISVHLERGEHPMSLSQFYVLQRINAGVTRASELARRARVSGPTMSGLVDRLVQGGFLARDSNDQDRRVVDMSLTPAGRALLGERSSALETAFSEMLAKATPAQLAELEHTCAFLAAALDERVRLPN